MELIFLYLVASLVVGAIGAQRKIGFLGGVIVCIILSPLLGLIIILISDKKTSRDYINPEAKKMREKARLEYQLNDLNEAVNISEKALSIQPIYPDLCYELSCYYSLLQNSDKSFYFLSKAIEQGWSQYNTIQTDEDLEFLRNQPQFKDFVLSGYKSHTLKTDISTNKYESLEKLGKLKNQGLISDEEFQSEKNKILNS